MKFKSSKQVLTVFLICLNLCFFLHANEYILKNEENLQPFACTSFAVYTDKPIYGMNFDYPREYVVKLNIEEASDNKFFNCGFMRGDEFIRVSGMNSEGFFSSNQILVPKCTGKEYSQRKNNEMSFWELHYQILSSFCKMEEVNEILVENRILTTNQVSIHLLTADIFGNAKVIDPTQEGNIITNIENDYIVMTNFPIYTITYENYDEAEGVGSERFKIAHDYILEEKEDFDWEDAMIILQKASMNDEHFATRCSMVFDPINKFIFIAVEMDYEHIWKVDLKKGNIQTYLGFEQSMLYDLNAEGMSIKGLKKVE